jgi:hypothetical protein
MQHPGWEEIIEPVPDDPRAGRRVGRPLGKGLTNWERLVRDSRVISMMLC